MVTEAPRGRLEFSTNPDPARFHGAWWPEGRRLEEQLAVLFSLWPPAKGRIARVLYSPPDWDDHPHSVRVGARVVKTGSFPRDDTQALVVSMTNGSEQVLRIIAPATEPDEAARILSDVALGVQAPIALRVEADSAASEPPQGERPW